MMVIEQKKCRAQAADLSKERQRCVLIQLMKTLEHKAALCTERHLEHRKLHYQYYISPAACMQSGMISISMQLCICTIMHVYKYAYL